MRSPQTEAATEPLPPVAARYRLLPPLPLSTARTTPSSGNRRNRGRVRRVDGVSQLLRKEAMCGSAGMYPVTAEREPEGVSGARRVEPREKRDLRRNPTQRVDRGIGVDVRPPARRRLPGDVRVVGGDRRAELDQFGRLNGLGFVASKGSARGDQCSAKREGHQDRIAARGRAGRGSGERPRYLTCRIEREVRRTVGEKRDAIRRRLGRRETRAVRDRREIRHADQNDTLRADRGD